LGRVCRVAKHGLIEFLPNDKVIDPWPARFIEAVETVRRSGLTNMIDHMVDVEEDYQVCVRMIARSAADDSVKKRKRRGE
jgi:hypothetical protein